MIGRVLVVALLVVGVGGCSAHLRIAKLRDDMADDARLGRNAQACAGEHRILVEASDAFGQTARETIRIRIELADSWAQWGYEDRALALSQATLSMLEREHGLHDERLVPALLGLARVHFSARRWSDAESAIDRTAQICHAAAERTDPPIDPFGECLGMPGYEAPRYYLAAGAYRKWFDEHRFAETVKPLRDDRDGGISMLTALGRSYAENGAYPEARWYLQRCVDELRPRYPLRGSHHRTVWTTAAGDVEVVVLDGAHSFHSQAPRCLEDLIAIERILGNDESADRLSAWQRELWAAGPDLEKQVSEQVRFADHAWQDDFLTSSRANNLAFYYAGKGRHEDARRTYEQAVALVDRAVARDGTFAGVYPSILHIDELLGLGQARERTGHAVEAETAYRRASEIAERDLHPRHALQLEGRARMARALTQSENSREAEKEWTHYLATAEKIRGRDHADYAYGLAGLADAVEACGDRAQAASLRTRAHSIRAAYRRRVEAVRDLPLPASLNSPPSPAN